MISLSLDINAFVASLYSSIISFISPTTLFVELGFTSLLSLIIELLTYSFCLILGELVHYQAGFRRLLRIHKHPLDCAIFLSSSVLDVHDILLLHVKWLLF